MKEDLFNCHWKGVICVLDRPSVTGFVVPHLSVTWENFKPVGPTYVGLPMFYRGSPAGVVRSVELRKDCLWGSGVIGDPAMVRYMEKGNDLAVDPFIVVNGRYANGNHGGAKVADRHVLTSLEICFNPPWPACRIRKA